MRLRPLLLQSVCRGKSLEVVCLNRCCNKDTTPDIQQSDRSSCNAEQLRAWRAAPWEVESGESYQSLDVAVWSVSSLLLLLVSLVCLYRCLQEKLNFLCTTQRFSSHNFGIQPSPSWLVEARSDLMQWCPTSTLNSVYMYCVIGSYEDWRQLNDSIKSTVLVANSTGMPSVLSTWSPSFDWF